MESNNVIGNKKKLSHLTAKQKLKILNKLKEGLPISIVAHDYNLNPKTICRWSKNRKSVEECMKRGPTSKQIRPTPTEDVNSALYFWFAEMRRRRLPVSGRVLKAKALQLHEEMGNTFKFVASEGWLSRWKVKYGVRSLSEIEETTDSILNNDTSGVKIEGQNESVAEITVTTDEAESAINRLIHFFEHHSSISESDMSVLRKVQENILTTKVEI